MQVADSKPTRARLAAVLFVATTVACWPSMASALGNHKQVMAGGGSGDNDSAMFTGPGLSETYAGRPSLCEPPSNCPLPDLDPALLRALVPMAAGVLSNLKVSCVRDYTKPAGAPDDYLRVTLLVRRRSATSPADLVRALNCECHFDEASECQSPRGARARLHDGDGIAVQVDHSLFTGPYHFTFSFLFN